MEPPKKHNIHRVTFLVGAFSLVALSLLTNPLENATLVIFYLIVLYIFLLSGGYWLAMRHKGARNKKVISKVFVIVTAVVLLIMLRSLNVLGATELLLLVGSSVLLYFYLERNRGI